ncbi:MAG: hypothetical protein H0T05_00475 [Acidobacteria bacterium]|nr:hypothetical protein [Acidobacteriota bacterium]MBA3884230.1 hypothetical protein [Acidobacteriota bacterium]
MIIPAAGRTLEDRQALSPDGKRIAYTAGGTLWIRNLAEFEPREVRGSQGARRPFWSPASNAVAYAADGALFKVSADGGTPVELCKITGGDFTGGSWSASQGLVFTSSRANWNGDVMRVSEDGGIPERASPRRPALPARWTRPPLHDGDHGLQRGSDRHRT